MRVMGEIVSDELLEAVDSCIFCSATGLTRSGTLVQDVPPVCVLECSECRAEMVDQLPKREFLDKLYTGGNYVGFLDGSELLTSALARRLAAAMIEGCSPSATIRILDFGGGSGSLGRAVAAFFSDRGSHCRITVVDIKSTGVGSGIEFFTPEDFDKCTETFDVILCSAVVEHLRDPGVRLRSLFNRLAEGGWIYVRSPQLGGLKRVRASWFRWPRHLSDFGPAFWQRFPSIFDWKIDVVWSRASRPETEWRTKKVSTVVAIALKAPCFLELGFRRLFRLNVACSYPLVGGWEFLGQKISDSR
jgi:SAM-dependent methyltransferase